MGGLKRAALLLGLAAAAVLTPVPARAQAAVTPCDRLAAHPSDPDKVTDGVATEAIPDLAKAIAACEADLAADPANARVAYQLGRVLFYARRYDEGLRLLEQSAAGGHRQAKFVLGLLYTDGREGVLPPEPCRGLPLWREAAERGHYAGEVSLSRNLLRGVYQRCGASLDTARVLRYLESARTKTRGYYEQILVEYLIEQARARTQPSPEPPRP